MKKNKKIRDPYASIRRDIAPPVKIHRVKKKYNRQKMKEELRQIEEEYYGLIR